MTHDGQSLWRILVNLFLYHLFSLTATISHPIISIIEKFRVIYRSSVSKTNSTVEGSNQANSRAKIGLSQGPRFVNEFRPVHPSVQWIVSIIIIALIVARFASIPRVNAIRRFTNLNGKRLLTLFNGITVSMAVYGSILNLLMAVVRVSMSFRPPWLQSLGKFCGLQAWNWAELGISFIYSFYGPKLLVYTNFNEKKDIRNFYSLKYKYEYCKSHENCELFFRYFLFSKWLSKFDQVWYNPQESENWTR